MTADTVKLEKLKRDIEAAAAHGDKSKYTDDYLRAYKSMLLQFLPKKETRNERRKKGK